MQKKTKRWHLVRNLNRNFGLNLSCRAVIVDIFYIHVYIIVMYIVYMTWFQWLHGSTAKKPNDLIAFMVALCRPWLCLRPHDSLPLHRVSYARCPLCPKRNDRLRPQPGEHDFVGQRRKNWDWLLLFFWWCLTIFLLSQRLRVYEKLFFFFLVFVR